MSGEKAHRAHVVSPDELHRRAVTAARARCQYLQSQLASLASQSEGKAPSVRSASTNDLSALQSIEHECHQAIRDVKAALSLQQSRARLELIAAKMDVGEAQHVTLGLSLRSAVSPHQEKFARVLRRLEEVESQATLNDLAERVSRMPNLGESEQQRALLELDHELVMELKQQRLRSRCQREAEAEVLKIAHVEGDLADSIRSRSQTATDQSALRTFRTAVREVLEEAEREANAAFITEQAMLVMAELGYAVDEPFELIEQHGDGFFARRDDLPAHALQVSIDATDGVLQTRVIAVGPTTTEEDVLAEDATCADALALARGLFGRGVKSETLFHRASGELPVAKTPPTTPRKKKRAQLMEMELNR